ncbi:MAG TPA: PQQ-binding-like beta-propeller repeat protein [Verrucomicrobiales bacterium]|nr:PQQ-binding-like beta-propeller repeat protein [Verrucomicrobiales bacterium]
MISLPCPETVLRTLAFSLPIRLVCCQPVSTVFHRMRLLFFLFTAGAASAADWPQFLGPQRDGRAPADTALIKEIPPDGYKILWKRDCGAGFAGPVVSGGKVILFYRAGDKNVAEALEVESGKPSWKEEWPTAYRDKFGFDEGPRSCPTVDEGQVFCYGADGILTALELAGGKLLWRKDLVKEINSAQGFFGRCCAPLVTGNSVLIAPGGEGAGVAAFDRKTGDLQWKALDDEAGYASPVLMHPPQGGRVVFFTREGVAGLVPGTGKVLFNEKFRSKDDASVNAATPVVVDSTHFFTSACYETGAALWEIGKGDTLTSSWRGGGKLDCHYSTPVLIDGNLYGFHGRQERGQELRCVTARDGEVKWSVDIDPGNLIACGKQLLILTERGELILTTASPGKAPDLTVRSEIIRGGHRAPPALAGGLLFAKDKSRLVCVDLRAAH